jgi:hypothetical protein
MLGLAVCPDDFIFDETHPIVSEIIRCFQSNYEKEDASQRVQLYIFVGLIHELHIYVGTRFSTFSSAIVRILTSVLSGSKITLGLLSPWPIAHGILCSVGEEYSKDRLIETVRMNSTMEARELVQTIHASVLSFSGKQELQDDFTLVILKLPNSEPLS